MVHTPGPKPQAAALWGRGQSGQIPTRAPLSLLTARGRPSQNNAALPKRREQKPVTCCHPCSVHNAVLGTRSHWHVPAQVSK